MPSRRPTLVALLIPALLLHARAGRADMTAEDEAAAAAADKQITALEGVYKRRFQTTFYDESKDPAEQEIDAEDIVEIARHDRTRLYFRAELQFRNGHTCSLYGIAGWEADAFVYRAHPEDATPGEPTCTLRITTTKDHVEFAGSDECNVNCGANGSLSAYQIDRKRRRPIKYLPRLKASSEYKSAVEELARAPRAVTRRR